ncbi:hypothetical protein GCM10011408_01340 [Dyella caseinilytica]|nr:hypothetical protein GCM10011408_01340 [Dyella caseinilytica]
MDVRGFQHRYIGAQALGQRLGLGGGMRLAGAGGQQNGGKQSSKAARTKGHGASD